MIKIVHLQKMDIDMRKILMFLLLPVVLFISCNGEKKMDEAWKADAATCDKILPVTGTFINLAYQDVRNKYTNPPHIDNTDPQMWKTKIREMKDLGMEYLVFMAVANEEKAYYPSKLMSWHYPSWRQSPVDAVMEAADECGMKVFMSTGWAKDQDDNLRDPKIKARQIEMMEELAGIYGEHPAFCGWYLPVEDCLGPVLTDYAVEAVNALTARARELTPSAKILISPYGIFNSDFDDPRYEQQISRLKVDIIAYQDEVGCVRERYPLTRLRENWKKLRAIHDRTGVEMWANCESFTWERGTNDRTSALIPAAFSRFLSQQAAATMGGADRIISFMMFGIYESEDPSLYPPLSKYPLGQPHWSYVAGRDYWSWRHGETSWTMAANSLLGKYGPAATEDIADPRWTKYAPGTHEIVVDLGKEEDVNNVLVRMLNCAKDGVVPPERLFLFISDDGEKWHLNSIRNSPGFPNNLHDAYIDFVVFHAAQSGLEYSVPVKARYLKVAFTGEYDVYMDELVVNPEV